MRPCASAACAAAMRGRRRRRRRLADLHVDDVAALRLDARRRRHHVHDDERRHIAALATALAAVLPRRASISGPCGLIAAPLLPYSAGFFEASRCHEPDVIASRVDRLPAASLGSRAFGLARTSA